MQAEEPDKSGGAGGARWVGTLSAFGAAARPAVVTVETLGAGDRMWRAARALLVCWALAFAAVFLPVLHFVLVPSLLLAGPVLAVWTLRQGQRVRQVDGVCPRCGVRQAFRPGGAVRRERTVDCPGCRTQLTLILVEPVAPAPPGPAAGR